MYAVAADDVATPPAPGEALAAGCDVGSLANWPPADAAKSALRNSSSVTVALLPGGPKTDHVHVNMYCDDRAISKGSPVNERACGIASTCGLNAQVRGDVFIGRVLEDDERFERRDFTIADLDSGSAWVAKARSLNIEKQMSAAGDGSNEMLARMQAMAGKDTT